MILFDTMEKLYHSFAILHFMTILLVMGFAIRTSFSTNITNFGCISGERNALLKLKASFEDPANRLSSWHTNTDCCTWEGVACDSNHVVGLHLRNSHWRYYYFTYWMYDYVPGEIHSLRSNHLDSSLLELKYLSYLDLSGNDFQLSPIPAFLGSMKQLQHFNLSHANFSGVVPHNLGNLSSLRVFDLSWGGRDLLVDDLMWASNLPSIEHFDMSGVNLSLAKHLSEVLFHMLPSIFVLRLSYTQLNNTHLPHSCVNSSLLTNIHHLDLSSNSFYGKFPCFLHNMTSLRVLDLSYNNYNSSSPHALLRLRNLVHLDLSGNELHHKIDWISEILLDKCNLKSLSLYSNKFYGELSGRLFRNLSMGYCWTHKLETLDLSDNQFDGHLPQEMSELKQLKFLYLSYNAFTGPIPTSIGKLRALRYLFLYGNNLCGELPISLGLLSNLEEIDLSFNSMNVTLSELHFAKLSKLEILWADSINLSMASDWVPPFQLKLLSLGSCTIGGGQFPQWLRTQKALKTLELWNCSISGSLPQWLHSLNLTYIFLSENMSNSTIPELPPYLKSLDLSHNMITGSIPKLPPYLQSLDLSHNMITGSIPKLSPYLRGLDLSHNMIHGSIPKLLPSLIELDMSHNMINGSIPKFTSTLFSLSLSDNMMDGSLPDSLCKLKHLSNLDLSKNQFFGQIPDCLAAMQNLFVLRLSSNELSGVIPNSIGEASLLQWLSLSKNHLTGSLPSTLKNCTYLEVLDVGENMLSGNLPDWIDTHLPNLNALRLGKNEFDGMIPSTFCRLFHLRVMDLSNNKLTGNISRCFGNLLSMAKEDPNMTLPGTLEPLSPAPLEVLNQVMKGIELEYTRTLRYLVNLDLSSNNLVGEIPRELTNLSGLNGLNLSHNRLVGEIPTNIGALKQLESLDLSSNSLHGAIPGSLSDLDSLAYLNLSHNHLSGPIPTGRHLQTLDNPSIYEGNPGLCGAILPKKCHDDGASKFPDVYENEGAEDEDDRNEKIIFYGIIASGFATGFWGIIGVLVLKRSWRFAFFRFAEDMICKMLGL